MNTSWGLSMAGCEGAIERAATLALLSTEGVFTYVELGVAGGKTFGQVCQRLNQNGRIWHGIGVDLPDSVEGFLLPGAWCLDKDSFAEATKDFSDKVTLARSKTKDWLDAYPGTINLLLIDACHEEDCIVEDFNAAEHLIVPGGVVIFHDTAPWSQDIDPQPHLGKPIRARAALERLELLSNTRRNWSFVEEAEGRQADGGRGCMVFQKRF